MRPTYSRFVTANLLAASLLGVNASAHATNYYLSVTGVDNCAVQTTCGTTPATAFKSFWYAQKFLHPGDTLIVGAGTYGRALGTGFNVTVSGTAAAPITFIAASGARPKILGDSEGGAIYVTGAHINIEGFNASAGDLSTHSAIEISNTHHILIRGNWANHSGCAGISVTGSDYLTILRNVVWSNSGASPLQCSGIDVGRGTAFDSAAGYHNFIGANFVYDNKNVALVNDNANLSDPHNRHTTDGSGIIVDTFNTSGFSGGNTLIYSNLSYNNGGSGIRIFATDGVTVTNNTVWGNNQDKNQFASNHGEIYVTTATNVSVYNNIAVVNEPKASGTTYAILDHDTDGDLYDYNCIVGGTGTLTTKGWTLPAWGYSIAMDPEFVNAAPNPASANFSLKTGSPASHSGYAAYVPAAPHGVNINLAPLITAASTTPDIGAY